MAIENSSSQGIKCSLLPTLKNRSSSSCKLAEDSKSPGCQLSVYFSLEVCNLPAELDKACRLDRKTTKCDRLLLPNSVLFSLLQLFQAFVLFNIGFYISTRISWKSTGIHSERFCLYLNTFGLTREALSQEFD